MEPTGDTATGSAMQNEASKILALINGGGAAALATLLQAVWDKGWEPAARLLVISGIWFTLLGLAFVPVSFVLRYINQVYVTRRGYEPSRSWLWLGIGGCYVASLLCFMKGMWLAIAGAALANGS